MHINLGPTPCDEACAQVGDLDYHEKNRIEGRRYIRLLKKIFPEAETKGIRFGRKGFDHDFGSYYEIVAYFDHDNDEAMEFASEIESLLPANWEEEKPFVVEDGFIQMNPHFVE